MGNNGGKWDKNFVVALLSLFAAIAALAVAVTTPEIRRCLGLEESSPAPQTPKVPSSPVPQPAPEPVHPPVEGKKTVQQEAAPSKPQPKPVAATPKQPPAEPQKQKSLYILHEDEPQDVTIANTILSLSFPAFKKESIVSLHISQDGGKQSNHLVWTGDSVEFSSSVGDFLVNILSVNVNEKKISVQVSKVGNKKSTL